MGYELFFAGVGTTILGTLLGVWLAPRITHRFQQALLERQLDYQRQLLDQQLQFQERQAQAEAEQRKNLHQEQLAAFKEFRDMINTRARLGHFRGGSNSKSDE